MSALRPALTAAWRAQIQSARTPAEALDERALLAHLRADESGAAAFLETHAGPNWRNLALSAVRAFRHTDRSWEEQEAPHRAWSLQVPILGADPHRPARLHAVDLVALDPDGEGQVSSLTGAFSGIFGLWEAAIAEAEPVRLLRAPLDYLRRAARVAPELAGDDVPPVCICWFDTAEATQLLLHGAEFICEDDAHAASIERIVAKLRKAYLPPRPRISVIVNQESAAAA